MTVTSFRGKDAAYLIPALRKVEIERMKMKTPREKYENDPHYHALVDSMMAMIDQGNFTPSELREAVIYAATRYEMMSTKPVRYMRGDV